MINPLLWIIVIVMQGHPTFTESRARRIAGKVLTECEATTGEVEPRPFIQCVMDHIPGVIDSEDRNE
jgi:hypothetical protein